MTSAERGGYSLREVMQKRPSKERNLYGIFQAFWQQILFGV